MLGSSPIQMSDDDRAEQDRDRFLSSHRALAACTREFGRLGQEIARRAAEIKREVGLEEAPEVRLTPGRCIVQLGPAALTLAWLRSTLDSVANGKLLVIAWRGTIAKHGVRSPERIPAPKSGGRTAVAVWEDTLVASGASEGAWEWESEGEGAKRYDSPALAALCVEQLRKILLEGRA